MGKTYLYDKLYQSVYIQCIFLFRSHFGYFEEEVYHTEFEGHGLRRMKVEK